LSDEDFETLCLSNDGIHFERTREGEIRMNAPTGGFTSEGNVEIIRQLSTWRLNHRRGRVFESNSGFFLPDGSMLSPDAAWVSPERLAHLTKAQRAKFLRLYPDFIIELLSDSDDLSAAQAKMLRWMENGVELGWLVDPYERKVHVYRPGKEPEIITGNVVTGSGPVEGFILDVHEVWSFYEV